MAKKDFKKGEVIEIAVAVALYMLFSVFALKGFMNGTLALEIIVIFTVALGASKFIDIPLPVAAGLLLMSWNFYISGNSITYAMAGLVEGILFIFISQFISRRIVKILPKPRAWYD